MDTFETFESLDRFLDLRLKTWNGKAKRKPSLPSGPVVALCFLLPPERRIALRLVAPLGMRLEAVMKDLQLPEKKAREHITRAERERRLYVKRFFKAEIAGSTHYDAVINLGSVPPQAVPGIAKVLLNNRLGKGN